MTGMSQHGQRMSSPFDMRGKMQIGHVVCSSFQPASIISPVRLTPPFLFSSADKFDVSILCGC
jgi:hypothetical protein